MRSVLLFAFAFLWINLQVSAQSPPYTGTKSSKASKLFTQALSSYRIEGRKAINLLNKSLDEDPAYIDAMMLLAEIYESNDLPDDACNLYRNAIAVNPAFAIPYYKLSASLIDQMKYDSALLFINQYKELGGNKSVDGSKVERIQRTAEFGKHAMANPQPFVMENLGAAVNSGYDDYFPTTTADRSTLIFTRHIQHGEDFFISKRTDKTWSKAANMGPPINTPEENQGSISITADGHYVFFTVCGKSGCDILFAGLDGDEWTNPQNLGFPVNTAHWESQPSVSFDGKTLYFTSDRPGGYGGSDIWFTTYGKGRWSPPQNMGPNINTRGNEQAPFIAKDDKTLYFNSTEHMGMGGSDIFLSRRQPDGRWGAPVNLGYPINSSKDEIALTVAANGVDAFYTSDRPGGQGGLDIYSFQLNAEMGSSPTGFVKGYVTDAVTRKPLAAKLELIDLQTGKTVLESFSNKVSGEFLFCLPGGKDYAVNVNKPGYLFYSESFPLKNDSSNKPQRMDVMLTPIQPGAKVILKNVFFDVDRFTLRKESVAELDRLVALMKANPGIKLEVGGHTDNTGNKQKNIDLSANRARAVADYLVQNGIEASRVQSKGYADSQPVADNKTAEGRQQNRRTEVKIVSQ